MDTFTALAAFSALSQPTRLETFRLLVRAGPDGMIAGRVGEVLGVRQNTLSTNLGVLRNAGLVRTVREGRAIRYFADFDGLSGLLRFLLEDCCGGAPELCRPLIDDIACNC
ncbi:ArsR family transcriptional regulator [Palleronia aestuarii]|uniref:ArsR family transcriptional regulator n=1 Tax=Palleronia aestuarii TaxID=568105 RepID=A0A2W7N301_9RHOB|nr:helix-turn-helix transcriptional regulator [Palleronia aestuarii]PZX14441.1 ArsR family transcriptional regulator [Palleronia aestuarii]